MHCAAARANYMSRVVEPDASQDFCRMHDAAVEAFLHIHTNRRVSSTRRERHSPPCLCWEALGSGSRVLRANLHVGPVGPVVALIRPSKPHPHGKRSVCFWSIMARNCRGTDQGDGRTWWLCRSRSPAGGQKKHESVKYPDGEARRTILANEMGRHVGVRGGTGIAPSPLELPHGFRVRRPVVLLLTVVDTSLRNYLSQKKKKAVDRDPAPFVQHWVSRRDESPHHNCATPKFVPMLKERVAKNTHTRPLTHSHNHPNLGILGWGVPEVVEQGWDGVVT